MDDTSAAGTAVAGLPHAWADGAGMIASIGCAIHCAAMPLVLAYLPLLGLEWLAGEEFHRWMAGVCLVLAAAAFVPGWRRHRSWRPAMWGTAGLLVLTTTAFATESNCCATCSADGGDLTAVSACSDASCSHCKSEQEHAAATVQHDASLGLLTALLTPFGGLLLVVGHLSNHRRKCRCQEDRCCLS
ncbi:MAG: MerC domain-containing protein [Planctomycetota bacterium]|nr:MAG: MerC domain-containing protein [Planctomycetota bacterium]